MTTQSDIDAVNKRISDLTGTLIPNVTARTAAAHRLNDAARSLIDHTCSGMSHTAWTTCIATPTGVLPGVNQSDFTILGISSRLGAADCATVLGPIFISLQAELTGYNNELSALQGKLPGMISDYNSLVKSNAYASMTPIERIAQQQADAQQIIDAKKADDRAKMEKAIIISVIGLVVVGLAIWIIKKYIL